MQSVLITGGAGFIGQNLAHAWRAARPADRRRCPDLCGQYSKPPLMIIHALEGKSLPVYGDGSKLRNLKHASRSRHECRA
jgi:dTDP-D-glucose 4,6-dehydratase